jgi:hypothetical protein
MTPLCAILIPSRKRTEALQKAIASVRKTVPNQNKIAIGVRYDTDDKETQALRDKDGHLADYWICGPRYNGYYSLGKFYTELAMATSAKWVWLFNDDVTVEGDWINDLGVVPGQMHMVHPQMYQIGKSEYAMVAPTTCPIVPNQCWKWCGMSEVPGVTDAHLYDLLVNVNRWQNVFLGNLRMKHERYADAVYYEHRKLN